MPLPLPLPLLVLLLPLLPITTPSPCDNKYIHIRHLPPIFNLNLLQNCSQYPIFQNFCPHLLHHGLGPKTHNSSKSWHRTDPITLELIFHRRILDYPCLTPDPNLASAIYLPYYTSISSLPYLYGDLQNSSFLHGRDLFNYLKTSGPTIWNRYNGHDHFLVMALPSWDHSQPLTNDPPVFGTSFLELPEFYNVTALTVESRPYPWQEHAIPYPTSFHPQNLGYLGSWINRVKRSKRGTLMMFAGGGGPISSNPNVRRSIRIECNENVTDLVKGYGYEKFCEFVDCSEGICEHDPIKFMRPMLGASFCLQPPGDTPTRRSTFDAIVAGCIPVFFEEMSAKRQYTWHLLEKEYGEFSVFIKKEDVVFRGVRIRDVLMGIPRGEVRRMREKVMEIIPRIIYRKHGSSLGLRSKKDAFDIAIEGTLQRIKERVDELNQAKSQR